VDVRKKQITGICPYLDPQSPEYVPTSKQQEFYSIYWKGAGRRKSGSGGDCISKKGGEEGTWHEPRGESEK